MGEIVNYEWGKNIILQFFLTECRGNQYRKVSRKQNMSKPMVKAFSSLTIGRRWTKCWTVLTLTFEKRSPVGCSHRRRMETETKAKVVASV